VPLAELTKEERELRRRAIGASEIGAIAGLNPWQSALDVWLLKTGRAEERPDNERSRMGKRIEGLIAEWYCEEVRASRYDKPTTQVHPSEPWMIASPDLVTSAGPNADRLCEIKLVGFRVSPHWRSGGDLVIPAYVTSQVLWQMLVTGIRLCDVAVWFGVDRDQQHIIDAPWMDDIAAELQQIGRDFWKRNVLGDIPPPIEATESWRAYLDELWPRNERPGIAEASDEADGWAQRFLTAKALEQEASAEKLEAEIQLKSLIGDLDGIQRTGKWRATWKANVQGARRFLLKEI
jgi:putative phage-type endonuclease